MKALLVCALACASFMLSSASGQVVLTRESPLSPNTSLEGLLKEKPLDVRIERELARINGPRKTVLTYHFEFDGMPATLKFQSQAFNMPVNGDSSLQITKGKPLLEFRPKRMPTGPIDAFDKIIWKPVDKIIFRPVENLLDKVFDF